MLLSNAIYNNAEPSTPTYTAIDDIEKYFRDLLSASDNTTPEGAEKLGAVAGAHRIFTNSIAGMPWLIRQKIGEERKEQNHAISRILKVRANEYMSPFMCMKVIVSQAFWHGVGYAYIERDKSGKIIGIIPIPVQPKILINPDDGTRWYTFEVKDNPQQKIISKKFTDSQLLIYRFESYDGSSGRGILDLAKTAIDTDIRAQKYSNKFYKNSARLSGIVEVPGELKPAYRDAIQDSFETKYSGENAFRVAVLDAGMKYTQLGISQQEAQYIETRAFSVDEISRFTGIPAYMLQAGKQSYQSNEQQQLDFLINTLTPHIIQIEQEWMYKLYSSADLDVGWYLKMNEAALLRGDNKSRAEYYSKMIGLGIRNQDECRALEDASPLPNGLGQHYWMSKNFDKIENFGKGVKQKNGN
jgi:HK97 family phage portal protein